MNQYVKNDFFASFVQSLKRRSELSYLNLKNMSKTKSPYDSITFGNPLSLRVDSNYLSIMSISPCGRDAVLAGRKGLLVVDLDDPFAAPRWLHHETSWEVADVQWSPHASKPSWIVSTSNQKAMVWNLARPSTNAIEYVLHNHTRAITDIHFHPQNPEMLATCSVDSFVIAWDLRCPNRPVQQWSDWRSGASQVKWNYKDPNILASSHANNIQIWDIRKGALPMKSIEGHDAKINGLDWSRENKYELISCSNDMSVKFWSFDKEYEKPVYTIRTDFPVAKTRHLPFGNHACGIMPMRGGNNSLYLVNYQGKNGEDKLEPVYTFKGHHEPVKDFVWRSRHSSNSDIDDREFQLVTWSADKDLRLWPITDEIYESVNFKRNQSLPKGEKFVDFEYKSYRPEPPVSTDNKLIIRHKSQRFLGSYNGTVKTAGEFNHLNWISGIKFGQSAFQNTSDDPNSASYGDNSTRPLNLGEEFSNVGHKFPKLRFERISVSTGVLVISLNGPWSSENKDDLIFIRIEFNFPVGYPSPEAIPRFKIEDTYELKSDKKQEILTNLQNISSRLCSHKRFCLETCLRYLLGEKVDVDLELEQALDTYDLNYVSGENDELFSASQNISSNESDGSISDIGYGFEDEDDDDEEEDDDYDDEGENEGESFTAARSKKGTNVHVKKAPFDSTPVSKGCGAIWTASGHLVCFFMSKEQDKEQHLIKFGQQGFSLVRNLKRKPVSSRLQINKQSYNNDERDTDSESSDDSLAEDFNDLQYDRLYRSRVPELLRNVNNSESRHFSSNARSNVVSVVTEKSQHTSNSKNNQNKNLIKIYDFRHLIPAKMELAYEYRILGDEPSLLAQHNALVAEKYGYTTIANCWKMLSVILMKDVVIDADSAANLLKKIGRDSSNLDILNNYRFYWGFHPFGGAWLVKLMFEYFEKVKDIQMLAVLSCILYENDEIKDHPEVPINLPFSHYNKMGKPSLNHESSIVSLQRDSNPLRHDLLNGGKLSPLVHNKVSFDRRNTRSIYPASPVDAIHHRMESVSTLSSYEYDDHSFKSSSPAGDMIMNSIKVSHNRRGIRHKNTTGINLFQGSDIHSNLSVAPQLSRSVSLHSNVFSQQFSRAVPVRMNSNDKVMADEIPKVNIQMMNTTELDLYENQYCVNIESFVDLKKLEDYRRQYASILFSWGLPANRLKVLKFNYSSKSEASSNDFKEHYGAVGWCEDFKYQATESPLEKWKKFHHKNKCNYCGMAVTKRLSVCSKCNHIMHDSCALEWWETNKMDQCPSGCGCYCLNHVVS